MPGFGTTSEIRPSRSRSRTISSSATRARSRVHQRPTPAISASAATASPRASNQLLSGNTARASAGPGPVLASVDDSLPIATLSWYSEFLKEGVDRRMALRTVPLRVGGLPDLSQRAAHEHRQPELLGVLEGDLEVLDHEPEGETVVEGPVEDIAGQLHLRRVAAP